MVETPDASPLERFCTLLSDAGVEFMVIGGQAEALMGSPRVTYDVDWATGGRRRTWSGSRMSCVP